jgi:hypothetical protein
LSIKEFRLYYSVWLFSKTNGVKKMGSKSLLAISILFLFSISSVGACAQKKSPAAKATQAAKTSAAKKPALKWRALFDGSTLEGWEHLGPGKFVLENGILRTDGGMGLLWYTKEKFSNSVIRVVYKTDNLASNSGVFIRIADVPKDEWYAVHNGYEVQILDKQDEFHRTGAIYSLSKSTSLPTKPPGQWNTMEIELRGPRVLVRVNGTQVNDFDPAQPAPPKVKEWEPDRKPRAESGYIGLQNHDDYAKDTHVYFKEVSVAPLQ